MGLATLRMPLLPTGFDALCWGIIGQQIHVKFASSLRTEMVNLAGEKIGDMRAHPTAQRVADIDVATYSKTNSKHLREFQFGFYPLPEATGEGAAGVGLVVNDVTVRKRGERRLRESEERFRTLIETSAAIVWTTVAGTEAGVSADAA